MESPLLDAATTVTGNSYLFQDVPSGVHLVRIRTVSLSGNYSDWVTVQSSGTTDVPAPINLEHGVPKCAITSSRELLDVTLLQQDKRSTLTQLRCFKYYINNTPMKQTRRRNYMVLEWTSNTKRKHSSRSTLGHFGG